MRKHLIDLRIVIVLILPAIACSSLSGASPAVPTEGESTPWMLAVGPSIPTDAAPTSAANTSSMPSAPPAGQPQDVSILRCQNDPSQGIVSAEAPVVLVWGWKTDNDTKRSEIISISSFDLEVDGQAKDLGAAEQVLESTDTVFWKLSIGRLQAGTHEIQLTPILARTFVESSGTSPAGKQTVETCHLVSQ